MVLKQVNEPFMTAETLCRHGNRGNGFITVNRREKYSHGFRWKLGINTNPCVQLRNGRRCIYCGFLNYRNPSPPSKVGQVFNEVFKDSDLSEINRLELYVSGSFFDDKEVSPNSRLDIIKAISDSRIPETVLESRPEFITEENLKTLASAIDPKRITIAVGVETMDDKLRNKLAKGFSTEEIVACLRRIAKAEMNFQAYLLLNSPVINNDKKAIIDIINSSKKLISLAKKWDCQLILAIQPFFVARNSLVAQNPSPKNSVKPPWLYSIALTLKLLDTIIAKEKSGLRVILGNEHDNVDPVLISSNYTSDKEVCSCTENTRRHLGEINTSHKKRQESIRKILESTCYCKGVWESEISAHSLIDDL